MIPEIETSHHIRNGGMESWTLKLDLVVVDWTCATGFFWEYLVIAFGRCSNHSTVTFLSCWILNCNQLPSGSYHTMWPNPASSMMVLLSWIRCGKFLLGNSIRWSHVVLWSYYHDLISMRLNMTIATTPGTWCATILESLNLLSLNRQLSDSPLRTNSKEFQGQKRSQQRPYRLAPVPRRIWNGMKSVNMLKKYYLWLLHTNVYRVAGPWCSHWLSCDFTDPGLNMGRPNLKQSTTASINIRLALVLSARRSDVLVLPDG